MYKKIDEILELLYDIAFSTKDLAFEAFTTYINYTTSYIRERISVTQEALREFEKKTYTIFDIFWDIDHGLSIQEEKIPQGLRPSWKTIARLRPAYPEEIREFVIPFRFGTKIPLIAWKQEISESKRRKLAELVASSGHLVTAGFRTLGRTVIIDIDVKGNTQEQAKQLSRKIKTFILEKVELPVKVTWTGGYHILVPGNPREYPYGLIGEVARSDGTIRLIGDKTGEPIVVKTKHGIIKVEILLDVVTVHPLQSWLWKELYYEKSEIVTTARLAMCNILPEHKPSINFFSLGVSYARNDVEEIVPQVLEEMAEYLEGEVTMSIKLRRAQSIEERKTALYTTPSHPFLLQLPLDPQGELVLWCL